MKTLVRLRNAKAKLLFPCAACAIGLALCAAPDARASGYLTARFGGDEGAPMMPNGYAVYFNPAALGGTEGTTITGDVSAAIRWAHYERTNDALSPLPSNRQRLLADPNYVNANTGNANLLNVVAVPFLGVNTDFGTKWLRAGYAIYVPFGGSADWDRDRGIPQAVGSSDGVQRWHNISGQIIALYNTFAVAGVIGDTGLSVGASISPVISHVATVRARTADDTDEIEQNGQLKEGRSYLNATGVNLAASAGLYYQTPNQRFRAGLAYLSQPGFGDTKMKGTLQGRTAGNTDVTQDIDFIQQWPDIVRLGGAYRLRNDKIELRTDGEYVRWSTLQNQCVVIRGAKCNINEDGSSPNASDIVLNIPRRWHDSIGWRAGAAWFVNDRFELDGSLAFSTSAVPTHTIDASTIDSLQLFFSVGARYAVNKHFQFGGSYTHIYYAPVDTKGANELDTFAKPSRSPSGDGKYESQIGFFNINAAYKF